MKFIFPREISNVDKSLSWISSSSAHRCSTLFPYLEYCLATRSCLVIVIVINLVVQSCIHFQILYFVTVTHPNRSLVVSCPCFYSQYACMHAKLLFCCCPHHIHSLIQFTGKYKFLLLTNPSHYFPFFLISTRFLQIFISFFFM